MAQPRDVSVVIPTHDRPGLLLRALRSAASQEPLPAEIIVVADGPDPRLAPLLAEAAIAGCRLVELPRRGGAPAARNAGIRAASSTWIALLDDDDAWRPGKLARQLAVGASVEGEPIVTCAVEVHTATATYVLPRRAPRPGEPVSEWLTVRRGLFHGEGFVQTSTLLARRSLFLDVPFDERLPRLQEMDWLLRALATGAVLQPLDDVLVVWDANPGRARISAIHDWRTTLQWAREHRDRFTPRAYAALLMSNVADMAASGDRRGFTTLLREARRHGRPSVMDYVAYLQIWALPPRLRQDLGGRILGRHRPAG